MGNTMRKAIRSRVTVAAFTVGGFATMLYTIGAPFGHGQ